MKKALSLFIYTLLYFTTLWAQSPQKMSYQAVIRDAAGKLVTNQSVGIQVSILQGSAIGTEVYKELHNPNPKTNTNGLVSIEIGGGLVITGTFTTINWANGPYFIKTEIDPTGGTTYTITGTSQVLSVPYALYAKTAESINGGITETDPVFNASVAKAIKLADTTRWGKKLSSYTETDPIYSASVAKGIKSTDTAKWNAKSNFSGNYADLKNKPTLLDNATIVTTSGDQGINGNKTFYSDIIVNGLTIGHGKGTNNYYNTALGRSALYSNTTGMDNASLGYSSLYYNSSGNENTAVGYYTLVYNTIGYGNTAIGSEALLSNTDGHSNTATGNGALKYSTSGTGGNTANGYFSLATNTSGYTNTAIGSYSDVASGALYNATAIGSGAIVDASNKVRIGNNDITVIEGKVAFTNLSDRRVKKNIKDLSSGLDFILKLHPVEYQMKKGDDKINYGFIAQDIEKLVGTNNSMLTIGADTAHTLGLRYTDFIAPMVKAMQEQQVIIDKDNQKISALEEKNKELTSEIVKLKIAVEALLKK